MAVSLDWSKEGQLAVFSEVWGRPIDGSKG